MVPFAGVSPTKSTLACFNESKSVHTDIQEIFGSQFELPEFAATDGEQRGGVSHCQHERAFESQCDGDERQGLLFVHCEDYRYLGGVDHRIG